jgi:hypothetical protein
MEQEPGPRGSPQLPHAPVDEEELAELFAGAANTESCGLSFELLHFGQEAVFVPKTRASKWWSHFWQMYSKIGIFVPSLTEYTTGRGAEKAKFFPWLRSKLPPSRDWMSQPRKFGNGP